MTIIRDGKIYYSSSELKNKLKKNIREKAIDIANEIKNEIYYKEDKIIKNRFIEDIEFYKK